MTLEIHLCAPLLKPEPPAILLLLFTYTNYIQKLQHTITTWPHVYIIAL